MSKRKKPMSPTPGQPWAERPIDERSVSWLVEAVLVFATAIGLFLAGYEILMYG